MKLTMILLLMALVSSACGRDQQSSAERDQEAQKAIEQGMQKEKQMYEGMQKGVEKMQQQMEEKKPQTNK